jgi:hypothetical protein
MNISNETGLILTTYEMGDLLKMLNGCKDYILIYRIKQMQSEPIYCCYCPKQSAYLPALSIQELRNCAIFNTDIFREFK